MKDNSNTSKDARRASFISELPLFAKIFYLSAAVSALLFCAYIISEPFADFFNRYISSIFRAILAKATDIIPFSLAEFALLMLPVLIVVLISYASKKYSGSWRSVAIYCTSIVSVAALVFSIFTVGFAAGYHGSKLEDKLSLDRADVSAEELYQTAMILADKANEEARQVGFLPNNFSVMPYTLEVMNDKLIDAFAQASERYDFLQRLDSRVKPVMLSEPMSYTHITGVYTFFTGEANINVVFPDYTIPFTAAHELAHQRGIAREDEANFVAFLVCMESDDAYIRYCAYVNMYEYVANALSRADMELYRKVSSEVCPEVRYEMLAYSRFFEKYRDSVASEVSGAVNNTYLTLQGTAGTASYGMVVDLAVAYYKKDF